MPKTPRIDVSPDATALAARTAEWLVGRLASSDGPFALNLSGGSTPKRLFALLASDGYKERIDWGRVHVFFGDERFVPEDHPDSNYGMARDALLSKVPIPTANVAAVPTGMDTPEACADAYAETLKRFYGSSRLEAGRPLFAVTLLGLGEDGHTASLFPGTAALGETRAWVTSVVGAKPEPRITMTYPVLESSAATAFLVAGAGKAAMLRRVADRDTSIPAGRIEPEGEFVIFCDEAARGA